MIGFAALVAAGTLAVGLLLAIGLRRLREKIEERPSHPRFLQTVWGVGYRFAG